MYRSKNTIILVVLVFGCVFVLPKLSVNTIFISNGSSRTESNSIHSNRFKQTENSKISSTQDFIPFNATNHVGLITIIGDSQVAAYASSGNGSESNPYKIENYNISSDTYQNLIQIHATYDYIIIQNCYFDSQER